MTVLIRPGDVRDASAHAVGVAGALALFTTGLAWLWAGLIEREPWKADEAYTVGMVLSIVEHGTWLVPTLAGEPFMEKPPLVFWLAALCAKALQGILPFHVAARMANVILILITFALVWHTVRHHFDTRRAWLAVWLLAACPALLGSTRYLTADLGLLAASGMVCLGLMRMPNGGRSAGAWVGAGAAVGLLSKGLLLPAATAVAWLSLMVLKPVWRTPPVWAQMGGALLAFACIGLPWPIALWLESRTLFDTWFIDNNLERFLGGNGLGPANNRLQTIAMIAGFLLPLWLFAAVGLLRAWRARVFDGPLLGPIALALVLIGVVITSHSARGLYVLPALVPMAIIAAVSVRPASDLLGPVRGRWAGSLAMLLLSAPLLIVFALAYRRLGVPVSAPAPGHLALTALLLLGWAWAALRGWRPTLPQAAAAGVTMALVSSLAAYLPDADRRAGFREVFKALAAHLPPETCVASETLGESERGMLEYYANRITKRVEWDPSGAAQCAVKLNQHQRGAAINPTCPQGWPSQRFERPHDDKFFELCAPPAAAPPSRAASR